LIFGCGVRLQLRLRNEGRSGLQIVFMTLSRTRV
jgi:hypothetical protein